MKYLKFILATVLLFWLAFGEAQIKYAILDDAGVIRVDASGVVDTTSSENVPPKEYIALLSQVNTDAPIATVYKNELGGTVVWTYKTTGVYTGTLAGAFPTNKTTGYASLQTRGSNPRSYIVGRATDDTVDVYALSSSLTATDPATSNEFLVHIRVYY